PPDITKIERERPSGISRLGRGLAELLATHERQPPPNGSDLLLKGFEALLGGEKAKPPDGLCTHAEAERKPYKPRAPVPDGVTRYVMARDLAGTVFPVSEDSILREARKHGIGRKMGRAIIFSPADIQHLYEVLPCYGSSAAASRQIGSSAAPSGASALKKVQALLTDDSPRKSGQSARAKSLRNPSTVLALPARSRKPRVATSN